MPVSPLKYLIEDARKLLSEGRLRKALEVMQGMMAFSVAASHFGEVESLRQSYSMLLSYMEQGAVDPSRATMYHSFLQQAEALCDDIERLFEVDEGLTTYAVAWRTVSAQQRGEKSVQQLLEAPMDYRRRFDAFWASPAWDESDREDFILVLSLEEIPEEEACLSVSAVTLSLLHGFDAERFFALASLGRIAFRSPQLQARVLVGWVLATLRHADRILASSRLAALVYRLIEDEGTGSMLEQLQMQLFLTLETKNIERRLREEIMPEMIKCTREFRIDQSAGLDRLAEKLNEAELNPEWENDGSRARLDEKMREISEMQQRGADVLIGQFKMLKQRFPYFQVVANWFYPFTTSHPDFADDNRKEAFNLLRRLLGRSPMCDSDKYSLLLMMQNMPQLQSEALSSQLLQAMGGVDEDMLTEAPLTITSALRSYVQDFYRFSHLFRSSDEFYNPFRHNLVLAESAPFNKLRTDGALMMRLGDFVFHDKSYALALSLYEAVDESERTAAVWQRIGFCRQGLGQLEAAVVAYDHASFLRNDSLWTLRQKARCLVRLARYEEAAKQYEQLVNDQTDDLALLMNLGECYLHLARYDDAFRLFFKVDYLAPVEGSAMRAIAWCSVLTGKFEQAERYYQKILADKPDATDYLNAGHTAWLSGHIAEAVARYREAVRLNPQLAVDDGPLAADFELLMQQGLTEDELRMMRDVI